MWQPYADYLVYSVLIALPWGGADLAEGAPAELDKLLESAEKYMELRPQQLTTALRPFFQGEDEASTSDSGAASFLGQVAFLSMLQSMSVLGFVIGGFDELFKLQNANQKH